MVAGAAGLCTLGVAEEASALPLLTLSGNLRGLYGSAVSDPALDPYGIGLGLSAGVTLPASLYLGASFNYFFGESESLGGFDATFSAYQLMAHVGYDLGVGPLTLRPSLGLGFNSASLDTDGPIIVEAESDFLLSPGAEAIIGLGLLTVSGELRYDKVFADDADAIVVGLGIGFSL